MVVKRKAAAPAADVKTEAKKVETKVEEKATAKVEAKVEEKAVVKTEAKAEEKKETAKKAPAKKAPAKKTTTAKKAAPAKKEVKVAAAKKEEKKETAKKAPAKKATAAKKAPAKKAATTTKAAKASEVFEIQLPGRNVTKEDLVKRVEEAYTAAGKKVSAIKKLAIYVKPEENAAYYVINDSEETGKLDI